MKNGKCYWGLVKGRNIPKTLIEIIKIKRDYDSRKMDNPPINLMIRPRSDLELGIEDVNTGLNGIKFNAPEEDIEKYKTKFFDVLIKNNKGYLCCCGYIDCDAIMNEPPKAACNTKCPLYNSNKKSK